MEAPELNAEPPLEAAYHKIPVPVALKLAIVGLAPLQNDWDAEPVGAEGVEFIVAVTSNLEPDSQLLTVCVA